MKKFLIPLFFCTTVYADVNLTSEQYHNLVGELASAKEEVKSARKDSVESRGSMQKAILANIKDNDTFNKIIKKKDESIAAEVAEKEKLYNSWGYKLQRLVTWGFWGIIGVYAVGIIGGFVNPLGKFGWLFRLSSEIVKAVPAGQVIRWFNPRTTTVRAAVLPVVDSPVNVVSTNGTTVVENGTV